MCADLQEDASYATEQLHFLQGFILNDGVVGLHSQNIVLRERAAERKSIEKSIEKKM